MRVIDQLLLLFLAVPVGFGQVVHVTHGQPPTLPKPFTKPIVANPPHGRPMPGFMPRALPGFKVSLFAKGFREPRYLAVAPNGDVFVAGTAAGKVYVLHDPGNESPRTRVPLSPAVWTSLLELPSTATMFTSRTPMR